MCFCSVSSCAQTLDQPKAAAQSKNQVLHTDDEFQTSAYYTILQDKMYNIRV